MSKTIRDHTVFYRSRKARNRKNPEVKEYYKAGITARFKEELFNGLRTDNPHTSPTRYALVRYKDNGNTCYYPLRLLFRTNVEQIVNAVMTNQKLPSDDTFNHIYELVNDLFPNETIDWYLREKTIEMTNDNLAIYNDIIIKDLQRFIDFDGTKEEFEKLEPRTLLGNVFTVLKQIDTTKSELTEGDTHGSYLNIVKSQWLHAAKFIVNKILKMYDATDKYVIYENDYDTFEYQEDQ